MLSTTSRKWLEDGGALKEDGRKNYRKFPIDTIINPDKLGSIALKNGSTRN